MWIFMTKLCGAGTLLIQAQGESYSNLFIITVYWYPALACIQIDY